MEEANSEFPIIKGVSCPQIRRHVREGTKYPFAMLEVGDHFEAKRTYSTLSKAMVRYREMAGAEGKEFAIRRVAGGFGVWRVA